MKVYELKPGMVIILDKWSGEVDEATVLAVHHPHPKYPTFELVLWHVRPHGQGAYFSHDCLMMNQEVGELGEPYELNQAWQRLLEAL